MTIPFAALSALIAALLETTVLPEIPIAGATADQDSALQQVLAGEANATSTQDSAIDQGEIEEDLAPVSDAVGATEDLLEAPASLLDLDVDLDLALDLAAPIDAAIAANLNIAAPIDAAVSANILSPGATSIALAEQNSVITQTLQGVANATGDQTSTIDQGESTIAGGD